MVLLFTFCLLYYEHLLHICTFYSWSTNSLNIFIYFKFTWKHDVPCDVLACLEIKEKFILWLAMRLLDMYYMNMYMKSSFTCMCNVY